MTLQQMEYIVAVDKHRHFAHAAESCGVTQSTLSSLIQKLEAELDVSIFDRNSHPIKPTDVGEVILQQARKILHNASQVRELIDSRKESAIGNVRLGISSSVAPFVAPKLLKFLTVNHPKICLTLSDDLSPNLLKKLGTNEIDIALTSYPNSDPDYLTIPLYRERFVAYISQFDPLHKRRSINQKQLSCGRLWILHDGFPLKSTPETPQSIQTINTSYASAHIETLLNIIDENGGFTIIPESQIPFLSKERKKHVKVFSFPEPFREVSFVIKNDFVRQKILNILADAIKSFVPPDMLNEHLKNFSIRL